MFKLLVWEPSKINQVIVEVDESGYYFDKDLVIWDERLDGRLTRTNIGQVGGLKRDGSSLIFDQVMFDAQKERMRPPYTELRRIEYLKRGLTFNKWVEMQIENDVAGMTAYRTEVAEVKTMYPRPA